eukprot:364772-Chlamydomonas_euryale.AAC.17
MQVVTRTPLVQALASISARIPGTGVSDIRQTLSECAVPEEGEMGLEYTLPSMRLACSCQLLMQDCMLFCFFQTPLIRHMQQACKCIMKLNYSTCGPVDQGHLCYSGRSLPLPGNRLAKHMPLSKKIAG